VIKKVEINSGRGGRKGCLNRNKSKNNRDNNHPTNRNNNTKKKLSLGRRVASEQCGKKAAPIPKSVKPE